MCFCSVETWAEGNPAACSVSFSHWDSRAGQCLFRLSSTSEKCSVRLRGDPPPTAWDSRRQFEMRLNVVYWFNDKPHGKLAHLEYGLCQELPIHVQHFRKRGHVFTTRQQLCLPGRGKKYRNYELMSWNKIKTVTITCTFLPRLTKNRLAAFTVGVSGNLSDKIPGENTRLKVVVF